MLISTSMKVSENVREYECEREYDAVRGSLGGAARGGETKQRGDGEWGALHKIGY